MKLRRPKDLILMGPHQLPDPKMPRYKPKAKGTRGKRFYIKFKEKFPQYAEYDAYELALILDTFGEEFRKAVVDNRDGAELPQRLGHVFMGACPPKTRTLCIDSRRWKWGNKIVPSNNFHSDGKLLKLFYVNYHKKYNFTHKELWRFRGAFKLRQAASHAFYKNWKKYIEVDNHFKIYMRGVEYYKKLFAIKINEQQLQDYDEFKMD